MPNNLFYYFCIILSLHLLMSRFVIFAVLILRCSYASMSYVKLNVNALWLKHVLYSFLSINVLYFRVAPSIKVYIRNFSCCLHNILLVYHLLFMRVGLLNKGKSLLTILTFFCVFSVELTEANLWEHYSISIFPAPNSGRKPVSSRYLYL